MQTLVWVPGVGGPFIETTNGKVSDPDLRIRLDYHPSFKPEVQDARPRIRLTVRGIIMAFTRGTFGSPFVDAVSLAPRGRPSVAHDGGAVASTT